MKGKITSLQRRLCIIAAIILVLGLGSAILIYLTAENASDSALVYEFENSKKYRHDLELYGGKLNVLADDLVRWFVGLWHGTTLAFTVACITIFISVGFFFIANRLTSDLTSYDKGENNQSGTD